MTAERPKGVINLSGKKIGWTDPDKAYPFWARVDKTQDCWLWTGAKFVTGYGKLKRRGRWLLAHRYAYEEARGPVPEGKELHHICGNPLCVRPAHLEALTRREHRQLTPSRPYNRGITHCKWGHPFDEDNTRYTPKGERRCRECARNRWREKNWGTTEDPPPTTHCRKGHQFGPDSHTRWGQCRQCARDWKKSARQKKKGEGQCLPKGLLS